MMIFHDLLRKLFQGYVCSQKRLLIRSFHRNTFAMANSKFEYVRSFEIEDQLEPAQWIAINLKYVIEENIDHSKVYDTHNKQQNAMTVAAKNVIMQINDLIFCYVYGSNCDFIFSKDNRFYKRRGFKLLTNITSLFCSSFVDNWSNFSETTFNSSNVPIFKGSIYLLPQDQFLRDYLTFNQYNCHLTNLYCTTLRNLINVANLDYECALEKVDKSTEGEKNQMLFSLCNINYNNEDVKYKKGSILLYEPTIVQPESSNVPPSKKLKHKVKSLVEIHEDFCKDYFWNNNFVLEKSTKHSSKYDIVKLFKRTSPIICHAWIVVRIDGKGFHKFSEMHRFTKPNDLRSLNLMNACAKVVMKRYPTIILSYGQSDEYSFVIQRYNHREKDGYSLISRIVSLFTGAFVYLWNSEFKNIPLRCNPSFDARFIIYPTNSSLRDYLSWRQVDCHINNMYNTCFWNLIKIKGLSNFEAQEYLKGTFSNDKLNILEKELNIKYYRTEPIYQKGTVIHISDPNKLQKEDRNQCNLTEDHIDLINDEFWIQRKWLLGEELKPLNSNEQL